MLYQFENNSSGLTTIDTGEIDYDRLVGKLGLKKKWELRAVRRVIGSFDKTDQDLRDNGHLKTMPELEIEARGSVIEVMVERELLKRGLRFINGVQQAVYGLNPKCLYELSQ